MYAIRSYYVDFADKIGAETIAEFVSDESIYRSIKVHGIAKHAKTACAGPLMAAEIEALSKALENPARP